jgi:hypothetical protein
MQPHSHAEPGPLASDGDRTFAMLIHLSAFLSYLVGPLAPVATLAMWLARRQESPFVDDHGREALNFAISIWIYTLIAALLVFVAIGCVILPVLVIFEVIVVILAAVKASSGGFYRYPMVIRLIPPGR